MLIRKKKSCKPRGCGGWPIIKKHCIPIAFWIVDTSHFTKELNSRKKFNTYQIPPYQIDFTSLAINYTIAIFYKNSLLVMPCSHSRKGAVFESKSTCLEDFFILSSSLIVGVFTFLPDDYSLPHAQLLRIFPYIG